MSAAVQRLQNAVAAITVCVGSLYAADGANAAELLERAVLRAATFAPGPTSAQFTTGGNGIPTPFVNKQPVQGFSAVLPGPRKGTYLVMPDNGFGAKANSQDALLRVYAVKPVFKTGTVVPVNRSQATSCRASQLRVSFPCGIRDIASRSRSWQTAPSIPAPRWPAAASRWTRRSAQTGS